MCKTRLDPHLHVAAKNWKRYLHCNGFPWRVKGSRSTSESPAQRTKARKRIPHKIWPWKSAGTPSTWVRDVLLKGQHIEYLNPKQSPWAWQKDSCLGSFRDIQGKTELNPFPAQANMNFHWLVSPTHSTLVTLWDSNLPNLQTTRCFYPAGRQSVLSHTDYFLYNCWGSAGLQNTAAGLSALWDFCGIVPGSALAPNLH